MLNIDRYVDFHLPKIQNLLTERSSQNNTRHLY